MGEQCLRGGGTQVTGGGLEKARQDTGNLRKILEYGVSLISWALKYVLEFANQYVCSSNPPWLLSMPGPLRRTKAFPMAMSQPGRCSWLGKGLRGARPSSS